MFGIRLSLFRTVPFLWIDYVHPRMVGETLI